MVCKFNKVLVITFILLLFMFVPNCAVSAQGGDSTPPEIVEGSIVVTPRDVGVGDEVVFTADVVDDISGLAMAHVVYRSPSNIIKEFYHHIQETGQLSATVSMTQTIGPYDEEGVWELFYIYVRDHAGNEKYFERYDYEYLSQHDFTVTNPDGDQTPPDIVEGTIVVTPRDVGVGDEVVFTADVFDDISGLAIFHATYKSPSGNYKNFGHYIEETGQLSATVSMTQTIGPYDEEGVWELIYIYVRDHAGNQKYFERYDYEYLSQHDFKVINPDGDSTPPEIVEGSIDVAPRVLGLGDEIVFTAEITDDISGIAWFSAVYKSPSNIYKELYQYFEKPGIKNETVSISNIIGAYDEIGTWELTYIYLSDHAGNHKYWNRDDFDDPEVYDFTVSYYGSLQVKVTPVNAVESGANWSIDEGVTWHDSEEKLAVATGEYVVTFKAIDNWDKPDDVQAKVEKDKNTSVNGVYSIHKYEVSISSKPTGGGTVSGGGVYEHGKAVTVAAKAHDSYDFVSWTKDDKVLSDKASYSFKAEVDRVLVANFKPKLAELENQVEDHLEKNHPNISKVKEFSGDLDPGATTDPQVYKVSAGKDVVYSVAWSGSKLKLSVIDPDGKLYKAVEGSKPPLSIVVQNAAAGDWAFTVTGVDVPHVDYPYFAMVGEFLYGDITNDGRIDVSDVVVVMRHALKLDKVPDSKLPIIDVNGDGDINVLDVTLIMRRALGLIDEFPL